jgi:multisubunit Na+/H+ antiporter MnhF subunit
MTEQVIWTAACVGMIGPLLGAVWLAARGDIPQRLAGAQVAAAVAIVLLVAMTFALDQSSAADVALTAGLLGVPAGLVFGLFLERWL